MRLFASPDGRGDAPETGTCGSRPARPSAWALPPLFPTLACSLAWGLAMGGSALAALLLDDWDTPQKIRSVILLFALGGGVAFPFGFVLARIISHGRRYDAAFAASFLSLAFATACVTGGFFALHYRSYYAEWHAEAFSLTWSLQFVFTVLSALYQFAVLGLRLYFPIGFVALLAASAWFARRAR